MHIQADYTPPQLLFQLICSLNFTQLPNRAICQFTVKPTSVNHVTSTCKENLPNLLSKRERKTRFTGSGVHWKGERISKLSGGFTGVRFPVAIIGRNGDQSNSYLIHILKIQPFDYMFYMVLTYMSIFMSIGCNFSFDL